MLNTANRDKPPTKGRLILFFILTVIHLFILLSVYFDLRYVFLIFVEFCFFLYYNRFSFQLIFRVLIISLVIFFLNLFFLEGKILFQISFFKATYSGLISGIKKSVVFISTFFFISNSFKKNGREIVFFVNKTSTDNLLAGSINFFLLFWTNLGKKFNLKAFIKKILIIYRGEKLYLDDGVENFSLGFDFYLYKSAVIFVFFIIIIFKGIKVL